MPEYEPLEIDDETEKELKEDKRKIEILESIDKSDLNWVLSDVRGRRFLCRLVGENEMLSNCYMPGSFDQTAYQLGQRSVGEQLFKEILEISKDMYAKMMREAEKFRIKKKKEKKDARGTSE